MAPKAGTPFDETTTTLAAASLLLFSPTQYQNFLWGIQIVVFVPAACLIWGLVVAQSSSSPWTKWVIAAGICIVATYSYSNGMLCWLLVLPALWRNWPTPRRKMLAGSWIFAAAVAVGIYRLGIPGVLDAYVKPAWTPALDVVAHRPMDAGKFFLAFLGQPLAEVFEPLGLNRVMTISDFCASVGAALLLMFAVAAIVAIRKSPSALPWICFGAYTLLSGILTTFGRLGFGVDFAVTPRYRTFGLYMIIATIYLGAMIAASSARRIAATICWLKVGLCTLFIIAMPSGLRRAAGFRTRELQGKGCLAFIDLIESAGIHTKVQDQYSPLRPRADLLDQAGYLHPPLVHATAMEQIAKSDGDVYGQFEGLQRSGNRCAAGGWAILPNRHEPSDVVVLAYQSTDGAHPFAILDTFVGRSDVAMALSDRRYSNCGWTGAFDAKDVPKDAGISAWAFDALSGKTHQLAGSFTLPGEQ